MGPFWPGPFGPNFGPGSFGSFWPGSFGANFGPWPICAFLDSILALAHLGPIFDLGPFGGPFLALAYLGPFRALAHLGAYGSKNQIQNKSCIASGVWCPTSTSFHFPFTGHPIKKELLRASGHASNRNPLAPRSVPYMGK